MSIIIEGEMGKGGKTPVETKDTLVSEQTAKLLFAVGEGVLHGYQDIYLDTIPISNFDATHDFRDGSAVQTVIPGFTVTEAPLPSFASTVVERGTTKKAGQEPIGFVPNKYYAIIPYTTDAARLTFSLSVMSAMDGDGNLVGSSITLEVWVRPTSASIWTSQGTLTKKGKTTHGYTFDTTIERPAGAVSTSAWEIMVQRVTPDSNSSKKQNSTTWAAVTQLYYSSTSFDNTYPNTALVGVMMNDAAQFGSRIPEVMFKLLGKRVRIPSNYNEATREYFGVWDGSFKLYNAYTNNPAWCLLDVLLDTRSGLSISLADVDIYAIYNLAKYADNMIDDGHGGTIPRYTLDYQFQNRQGVREFLSQILSLCNANFIVNEFGQLSVIFQAPGQAVTRNVANANVIDGSFTYQSSDIEKRTNLVNVTYNNGLNFGRTDTATVKDDAAITRYGLQVTDVVLPGCLYEAQAIRKARWALYTNCYFTNLVTFSVFLEGLTYKVGDLIRVFDNYNQDSTQSGIVTSCTSGTTTTLTFDRAITLPNGTYTFYCYDTSGNEVTKSITGPVTLSSIVIPSNVVVNTNSIFIFSGSTGLAAGKLYRVMSIDKSEDSIYSVTALEFSESIFTYIEQGISLTAKTGDFANLTNFVTPPVTAISVLENFGTNGVYTSGRLQVSWVWDAGNTQKYRAKFKLTWVKDDGIVHIVNDIGTDTLDIMDPTPGIYTITVWAVNPFTGISSGLFSTTYSFRVSGGASSLQAPLHLRITGTNVVSPQPTSLNFDTQDLSITFDYNPANTNVSDALYDYVVEIWDSTGTTKKASYSVNPFSGPATVDPIDNTLTYIPLNGLFLFPFNENVNVFGGTPARTFIVKVYSRDTLGDLSAPIGVQFTNPVPAFTTLTVTPDIGKVLVVITASSERDSSQYLVYRGTTSNFTPNDASLVYQGPNNSVTITTPDTNNYYYKASISDTFGSTGLNVSGAVAAASISSSIDRYSYTGLQFSTNKTTNVVSWTAFTAYKGDGTSESISTGSATWTSGVVYLYYVPGNTTLQSTTNPLTAVSGRILATYVGGNNITADAGKAFIDGDQLIAGSLLANALATDTAYITNMAQIGNIIQSDNYNDTAGSYAGWRIDKNGVAKFTGLVVRSGTLGSTNTPVDTAVSNAAAGVLKNKTFYAASTSTPTPTADNIGDLWYQTDTAILKRWNGTSWQDVSNNYTNTNQLTDGAGLGATAVWTSVSNRPTSLATLNATDGTTLSTASTNASSAKAAVDDMSSDSVLAPVEKISVRNEWNSLVSETSVYDAQAIAYGVSRTAYDTAFQNLANYLNGGSTWSTGILPLWINDANLGTSQGIDATIFRAKFTAYYDARVALTNSINAAIKAVADTAKTTADSATNTANSASSAATAAQNTANSKNKTYAALTEPPSGMITGDMWINTTLGNKLYRYDGTQWVPYQDTAIATAQSTADGKNKTYYSSTAPSAITGDLWYDTTTSILKRWNGSSWVNTVYTPSSTQGNSGGSAPTSVQFPNPKSGDSWFDTSTNLMWYYSSTGWSKVMPLMTSTNISNFVDSLAIGATQIANASIGNAKIVDLNANKIINNTLIKSTETYMVSGSAVASGTLTQVASLTRSLTHRDSGDTLLLLIQGNFDSATTAGRYFSFQLAEVSSSALIYQWNAGSGFYQGYSAPERIIYNSTSDSTTRLMVGTACWPIMYRTDAVSNWQFTRQTDSSGNYIDIIVTGDYKIIMNYKHAAGANRTPTEITLSAQDIFK